MSRGGCVAEIRFGCPLLQRFVAFPIKDVMEDMYRYRSNGTSKLKHNQFVEGLESCVFRERRRLSPRLLHDRCRTQRTDSPALAVL